MGRFEWSVISVEPSEDYTLSVMFHDGKRGVFDVKPLLEWEVYGPLRSLSFFMQARVAHGTVVWSDGIDISPERLYEQCRPTP